MKIPETTRHVELSPPQTPQISKRRELPAIPSQPMGYFENMHMFKHFHYGMDMGGLVWKCEKRTGLYYAMSYRANASNAHVQVQLRWFGAWCPVNNAFIQGGEKSKTFCAAGETTWASIINKRFPLVHLAHERPIVESFALAFPEIGSVRRTVLKQTDNSEYFKISPNLFKALALNL